MGISFLNRLYRETLVGTLLKLSDSDASNDLTIDWTDNDTADRSFGIQVGGGDRTLALSGNLTVEAVSVLNQDLTSDAQPVFSALRLNDTNATHQLTIAWNENDTSARTLNLLVNGASPSLSLTTGTNVFQTSATVAQLYGSSAASGDLLIDGTSSATRTTSLVTLQAGGGNIAIGAATDGGTSANKVVVFTSGTAPTTSPTDAAQLWVADQAGTAGKAQLHMRNEAGQSGPIAFQAPFENLLDNSGFGVWSNSDANQGLGSMPYDAGDSSGHTAPVVGETMTGGTSGAVGKIISYTVTGGTWAGGDAVGVITLGACSGRFNDNEVVTGGTGAAHCVVNTPAGAAGVDLVKGGECEAVTDWAGVLATPTVVAGGQVGNMMTVTNDGAATGYVYQSVTTVSGKIYRFKGYFKKGSATSGQIKLGTSAGASTFYDSGAITDAGWAAYTRDFEATSTTTFISLYSVQAATNTALFDEVSLYEITPCCTAADTLAMDGWIKNTNLDLYRQHNDGGTLTHDGSFHSLKLVPSTNDEYIYFPGSTTDPVWIQRFAGRTVTIGAWVKTSAASHFRFRLAEGETDNTFSSYHSGGGGWEWLEVSKVVGTSPSSFSLFALTGAAPNVNGSTIVYVSQPMLVFGPAIGEGNFVSKPNEFILTEKVIPLTSLTATTSKADATINLEAESAGMIPKGCKAVLVKAYGKDSAAGDGVGFDLQTSSGVENGLSIDTQVNNIRVQGQGWVACDANGDFYFDHRGSGAAALTVDAKVIAVELR